MNLIFDRWIPVARSDGTRGESIAPWQITDAIGNNPVLAIASPRPDFDGALTQFLIGLLQTTCMPDDDETWFRWLSVAPSPEALRDRVATVAEAFELEGEKAFMQDFRAEELTTVCGIASLLIDAPGKKTLKENTDHFVKRHSYAALCAECAAAALFTLQVNSPLGGSGHLTGLRGGGPLTTLVLGDTLWETSWRNVLVATRYADNVQLAHFGLSEVFPWLAATRVSEGGPLAGITTPVDVSPHQQYWPMPRRIRLKPNAGPSECATCGRVGDQSYREYATKTYGVKYEGFEHPLSPHYVKDEAFNPVHPQAGGLGYRHWIGLVENDADGKRRRARVVEQFRVLNESEDARLWAFGFEMDNMKPRCWYSATMPVVSAPQYPEGVFAALVERMVRAADQVARDLGRYVKVALFGEGTVPGDVEFVRLDFWAETETEFYAQVFRLRDVKDDSESEHAVMESWLKALAKTARTLFERHTNIGDFDAVDPGQVAAAYNDLSRSLYASSLRRIVGLPDRATVAAQGGTIP